MYSFHLLGSATMETHARKAGCSGEVPSPSKSGDPFLCQGKLRSPLQWDAEGRLTSIDSNGSFAFNALGWRQGWPGHTNYLYDPAGQLQGMDWGSGGTAEVRLGGRRVAYYGGQTSSPVVFLHASALNSDTQQTDAAGGSGQAIVFYPWGDVWENASGPLGRTYPAVWASLEQTDLSGTGFLTPNRSYVSTLGRWLSPDPLGGDLSNPQSLNRYSYVLNNPATLVDPLGLGPCRPGEPGYEEDCPKPAPTSRAANAPDDAISGLIAGDSGICTLKFGLFSLLSFACNPGGTLSRWQPTAKPTAKFTDNVLRDLRLVVITDQCEGVVREIDYALQTTAGGDPRGQYYVSEHQSNASVARGGAIPNMTTSPVPNRFVDSLNPLLGPYFFGTITSTQFFSVSMDVNPNSPGSMVIIRGQSGDRGTNFIQMTTNGVLVNGQGCGQ